jgi:hypothetical protein
MSRHSRGRGYKLCSPKWLGGRNVEGCGVMFDLMATKKGRIAWFFAALVGGMLGNILMSTVACQPPSPNTSPQPAAQTPVSLGPVAAEGTCKGSLGIDLQVGVFSLPIRATLDTHASPGGASGVVALDVGGLLQAQCEMLAGEGKCAVSGLLAPRAVEPAPALTVGGGEDAPP